MSASNKKKMRKEHFASAMTEKQQAANKEAKKLRTMTISFIVVIALILGAFAYITVDGVLTKLAVYENNTIIANIDGNDLNMIDFTYYYIDAVESYYNNVYETYTTSTELMLASVNLDLSGDLTKQTNPNTNESWFDYFAKQALNNAKADFALCKLAEADAEFDASEAVSSSVSTAETNLNFYAMYTGFGSVENYLRNKYCNGANLDNYKEYVTRSVTASEYYNDHLESLSYSDADYRKYEADNYNMFSSYNFASYTLSYTSFLEGGTEDEKGNKTYSDEEKAAARQALMEAAEKLAECTSVEDLDAAIAALPFNEGKDVASNKNTAVLNESLKEVYADWLGAADRVEGDTKAFPVETTTTDENGNEITIVESYTIVTYQGTIENLMHLADVRHLLVKVEATGEDEEGNKITTAGDKENAREEASELYTQWLAQGGTEDQFIELVKKESDDGSASTGGLFEGITPDSSYVAEFRDWAMDPEREKGDSEIIETEYGYHIMYFVGHDEMTYRDYMIDNTLKNEAMEKWYETTLDSVTAEFKEINKLDKVVADNLI